MAYRYHEIESAEARAVRVQALLDAETLRYQKNPRALEEAQEGQRFRFELYQSKAPTGEELDNLERERMAGRVGIIRQLSPGVYTYTDTTGQLRTTGELPRFGR